MELDTETRGEGQPFVFDPQALQPKSHLSRKNIIIGIICVLALVVFGFLYYAGIFSYAFLSKDVKNLSYIDADGGLLTPTLFGFVEDDTYKSLGDVLAVHKGERADVAIVRTPEGAVDVALYAHDGTPTFITSDRVREEAPVVSDSGEYVAYAKFSSTVRGVVGSSNITEWHVYLWSKQTGSVTDLGVGYGPAFVNDTTVLMTTLDGVVLYDIASQNKKTIPLSVDGMKGGTALVSGSGAYIVVYNSEKTVYDVYALNGESLVKSGTLDAVGITSLTSRGDVLYALSMKDDRSMVKKGTLGGDVKLKTALSLPLSAPVISALY